MMDLLLANPWVYFYLAYAGALWVYFLWDCLRRSERRSQQDPR
jgi:hypothetical protein